MKLRISYDPGDRLSRLSRKLGVRTPLGLLILDDRYELIMFFPRDSEKDRDLMIFINEFNGVKRNGIWRVRRRVNEGISFVKALNEIISVNSAVLSDLWISEGRFNAEIVFHEANLKEISEFVISASNTVEGFSIEYLGRNGGFEEIFSEINRKLPLSVVEIDHVAPAREVTRERNPMGDRWTRIAKIPYGYPKVAAVYFVDRDPGSSPSIRTVVPGSIYRADTDNEYVELMNGKMNDDMIGPVARIYEFDNPHFRVTGILPSMLMQDYIRVFAATLTRMSDWKPVLTHYSDLSTWLAKKKPA